MEVGLGVFVAYLDVQHVELGGCSSVPCGARQLEIVLIALGARCGVFAGSSVVVIIDGAAASVADALVCVFDFGLSGEARAGESSVGLFFFEDELPCIQVRVVMILEDAYSFGPFLLLRAVGGVLEEDVVESEELFGFLANAVVEVLAPEGLLTVDFHGWSNAALEAW